MIQWTVRLWQGEKERTAIRDTHFTTKREALEFLFRQNIGDKPSITRIGKLYIAEVKKR